MVSGLRSHEHKKGTWYLGHRTQKRNTHADRKVRASDSYSDTRRRRKITTPKPISTWISDSSYAHAVAHYIITSWLSPLKSAFRLSLPSLSLSPLLSLSKKRVLPFCQILRSPLLLGWAHTLVRVSGVLSFLSPAVESDGRQGLIFQQISDFGFAFFWRFTEEGRRFYCLHGEFSLLGSVQSLISFRILQLYPQKQRGNIFVFLVVILKKIYFLYVGL